MKIIKTDLIPIHRKLSILFVTHINYTYQLYISVAMIERIQSLQHHDDLSRRRPMFYIGDSDEESNDEIVNYESASTYTRNRQSYDFGTLLLNEHTVTQGSVSPTPTLNNDNVIALETIRHVGELEHIEHIQQDTETQTRTQERTGSENKFGKIAVLFKTSTRKLKISISVDKSKKRIKWCSGIFKKLSSPLKLSRER